MKKKLKVNKTKLVLGIVMSSLIMVTLGVSSFAYWQKDSVEVTIPTYEFNATEEEFTYYACVPNVASTTGYDYYDLESIPTDLVDRVTALAAVRFEALTKTAYIPSYPKVTIGGTRFNYSNSDLPVIHVLNSLSSDDAVINNGFSHIETLIIPETITYIQPGSFLNSTNLKEVTILGELNPDFSKDPKAKKAGYLSVSNTEFGSAKIYKKDANRVGSPSISLNTTSLRFAQFGTSFEYDNKTEKYYTYVVTGDSAVAANALAIGSPSLSANTKYKLTYDGSTITATSYTYSIDLGETTSALVLNTNVNYEEYILNTDMNVVRISSYPVVEVQEFINGELNSAAEAEFDLNKLNASYSSDNIVFDIKYAPSHVYESIHYHTDGEDLLDEKTMTQISAEKAYFLNKVSYKEDVKNGENFIEVTVSDDSYLDLYVRATNEEYGASVYYVDPTDPDGINTYIQMEKVGTKYRYEFRGSNAPDGVTIPDEFLFYNGQYSVISYPEYINENDYASEAEIQEALEDENHGTRRVYLQLYKDNGEGNINATMINDDKNPTNEHDYRWYVVYWYNENGKEKQHYFRVYYADSNSTVIIADIPEIAEKFKFVRTNELDTPIKDALKNNWVDMENYCAEDLKFNANPELNLYVFNEWWKDSYYNQFSVTNDGSMPDKTEFKLRNKNYLILSNYGQLGADGVKYLPIDESLGYPEKDVTGEGDSNNSFKLEFTRFDNYLDRNIQVISLPKGTLIEARVINISSTSETPTYFANTMGYPSEATKITANDKDDVAILNPSEFFVNDGSGKIKVLKDCTVEVYLKMEYSESEQSTPVDYKWHFNIKSTGLRGFTREVIVNPNDEIEEPTMTSSTRQVGSKTYPTLVSTDTVVKLERNHANTEFEEYRYLNGSSLTGEYVVSPYFEGDRVFGGSSGNTYYGTINPTSPSGELDLTNENLIMFSPNGDKAYEYKYYAAFDDYGNFLTFLSFNRTQTIKEGYQVLSAVVPQALRDFQNVYIYEVDSEGNIIGNPQTSLNAVTNLNTLLQNYNESTYANTNDYIEYDQGNELMFDYFIRQVGQFGESENFYTNNIGVTYGVLENPNDQNSDVLYYFNNVKLDLSGARDSSERYQITTQKSRSEGQTIYNNIEPLDEQIIDGYYYNGISITGNDKNIVRFMKEKSNLVDDEQYFKEGYYDLVLRKRGGKLYLGYKYLGDEALVHTNYYLYIYQNDELIDTVKMDHMYNDNHYFADICYEGTIKVEVYNEQKVRVYYDNAVTYTSTTDYISRFYYGVNTFVTKVDEKEYRLYESKMGKIALDFNMGSHPIDDTNIRYNETDYLSDLDYYEVKVKAVQATDIYYVKDNAGNTISSLKKHGNYYSEYITNTEFNKVVKIYLNEDYITDKTITLPQPGKYEVSYNSSTGIISCIKVQNPDVFYLYINDEMVAELEVNPQTNQYYEYEVEEHIVLEKELNITANDIRVLDSQGNLAAIIDKVTLTENLTTSTVTSIDVGAYALTYSVDSSRREGDKYQVFTYLNFTPLETATIKYYYLVSGEENEVYTTISKLVVKDINWKFEVLDLETIETFYTPQGTYFAGWSTDRTDINPTYIVGEKYGTNADLVELYPIFKNRSERHQVVWVKAPDFDSSGFAIFSLTNLETTHITGVSYVGYDDYINGTNGKPKYVTINPEGNRIVTVDQSLFETIGYVNGGIKLTVHLVSEIDGKTSTCTVEVNYPNYDNREPSTNTYFSKFSSSEYTNNSTHASNEKTITSLNGTSLDWRVYRATITSTTAYNDGSGEASEENLCLSIKHDTAGYAITTTALYNIKNISFYSTIRGGKNSNPELYVCLVDGNDNLVEGTLKTIKSSEYLSQENYKLFTFDFDISGAYYIKFYTNSTSASSDPEIKIDNLSITTGSGKYTSTFTSGEYESMGRYATEDSLKEANNDYSFNWHLLQARFNHSNSYGNEGGADKANLALAIRRNGSTLGYAHTEETFTSFNSISFDLKFSYYTNDAVKVQLVDASTQAVVKETTIKNTSNNYERVSYDFNYSGTEVYLKFIIDTTTENDHIIYIDNLEIQL